MGSSPDDIELIKKRKMLQLMKQQILRQLKEAEKKQAKGDIYLKLKPFLTEEAFNYLMKMRREKRATADEVVKNIVYGLLSGVLPAPVDEITVEYIERKVEGRTGRILVQRRGELKSLGEVLREEG